MVRSYTFLPLFREPFGAQAAKDLKDGLRPTPSAPVVVLAAPVRGLAFFAHEGQNDAELDVWWAREVEAGSRPVVLLLHEDGLSDWLAGTDADYWLGAPAAAHSLYAGLDNVHLIATDDPQAVVEFAMQSMLSDPALFKADQPWKAWHLSTPPPIPSRDNPDLNLPTPHFGPEPTPADVSAVLNAEEESNEDVGQLDIDDKALDKVLATIRSSKPDEAEEQFYKRPQAPHQPGTSVDAGEDYVEAATRAPERRGGPTRRPTAIRPEAPELQTESAMDPTAIIDPFSLLASAPPTGYRPPDLSEPSKITHATSTTEIPTPTPSAKKGILGQVVDSLKGSKSKLIDVPAETGRTVTDLKPLIIAVASRKGGVGKTASAGAIAILLAEAVDRFGGWQAALVDANIINPDSWGLHDLPEEAPTLRQVIAALMRGGVPPDPIYAKIPAPLAVYPEDRNAGEGYDSGQITSLITYLKGRFAVIVFDLPNTMPDLESPAGRMASYIISMSDVVVLPLTADKGAFQGVFDYLASPAMKNRATVVPYIVPADKFVRKHAGVQQLLSEVASKSKIVEITDDDGASRALWTGQPITTTSPQLRADYIDLVNVLVATARAGRM
jgi:cellulose biosynthesis protein BcsQ